MPSLSWHWLNGGMLQPVVVLAGGLSHQRDISLKSGRTVAQALRRVGHEVVEADIDSALIETLRANDGAVVFPMLHGGLGENGALLEVLQLMGIPYVCLLYTSDAADE